MILYGDEDFVKAIADVLEVSRQTAGAKLKGESEFTQTEIAVISKHYCLNDEEIRKIFIEGESNSESERSSEVIG
jgi:hypothetical protein